MKLFMFIIISLGLALPAFSLDEEPLFFVQITDTHYGRANNHELIETAIRKINRLNDPVSFVAVTGDIMNDNIKDESADRMMTALLKQCRFPVYCLPGNHDITAENTADTVPLFEKYFGPLSFYHDFGRIRTVFLFTEPCLKDIRIPGYEPLNSLESILKQSGGKNIIIFTHHPSAGEFENGIEYSTDWEKNAYNRWSALLKKYSVKAVIAGHFHRDELQYINKTPVFVCPSVDGKWSTPSFRLYRYSDGRLTYHTLAIR